jgi:hypothetical protein
MASAERLIVRMSDHPARRLRGVVAPDQDVQRRSAIHPESAEAVVVSAESIP